MKKLLSLVLSLLVFALPLAGIADEAADEPVVVKVGVVGENNENWNVVTQKVAEQGIIIELVKFADYALPNRALLDGDIDLNAFQHYAFLNDWNEKNDGDLVVIADTLLAPLGIYSTKLESLDQLEEGARVAIMNDATNEGRAILILQDAGLITLKEDAGPLPILADIIDNPLNLEFYEVEAAMTASLLPDVEIAFINGGHAVDNNLFPETDSIYLESLSAGEGKSNPYVNVIAARPDDADNPIYQTIIEAYHTPEVAQVFIDVYKGAYIPAWDTGDAEEIQQDEALTDADAANGETAVEATDEN